MSRLEAATEVFLWILPSGTRGKRRNLLAGVVREREGKVEVKSPEDRKANQIHGEEILNHKCR